MEPKADHRIGRIIQLLLIGSLDIRLAEYLGPVLMAEFGRHCRILPGRVDPQFAFNGQRQQYHSTELLAHLNEQHSGHSWRVLGITDVDLFIPILTFVFGEAQLGGCCALVSTHRLRQEFYGLAKDQELLKLRLAKEAVHEMGHTLGLKHCPDYSCVMASSHGVEWIDLKGSQLCAACRSLVLKE